MPARPPGDAQDTAGLAIKGQKHNLASYVTATCCQVGCEAPLCGQQLYPCDRGTINRRLKLCGKCIQATARCTVCGMNGVDSQSKTNRETNGKFHHRWREPSLWPCGQGCYNLLCTKCGTTQDGCDIHRRQFSQCNGP